MKYEYGFLKTGFYGGLGAVGGGSSSTLIYQLDLTDGSLTPQTGDAPTFSRASTEYAYAASDSLAISSFSSGTAALETWPYFSSSNEGGIYIGSAVKNDCLQSEDFATTWTKINGAETITANSTSSPFGDTTADTIAGAGAGQGVEQAIAVASANADATFSVWAKVDSGTATFSLRAEDAGATEGTTIEFIATTEWRRYAVSHEFSSGASGNSNVQVLVGDTSGYNIYFWGAQFEASDGVLTDNTPREYVPTTTAAVTKANDDLELPASALTGAEETGTLSFWWYPIWNVQLGGGANSDGGGYRAVLQTTTDNDLRMYFNATVNNASVVQAYNGTTLGNWSPFANGVRAGQWHHMVLAWDNSGAAIDYRVYLNGSEVFSDTSSTPSTITAQGLRFGGFSSLAARTAGSQGFSNIKIYSEQKDATAVSDLYDAEKADFENQFAYLGYPASGRYEPDVAAHWVMDSTASSTDLVDKVSGITLPANDMGSGQTVLYEQSVTGEWANLGPAIDFAQREKFTKTTATPELDLAQNDAVIESVMRLGTSQANNIQVFFDTRDDSTGYGYAVTYNYNLNRMQLYMVGDSGTSVSIALNGGTFPDESLPGEFHKYRYVIDRSGNYEGFIDGQSWGTGSVSALSAEDVSANEVNVGGSNTDTSIDKDSWRGTNAELRITIGNTTNDSGNPGPTAVGLTGYDYGWPAGVGEDAAGYEPDVKLQWTFDEQSGGIVDRIQGVVLAANGTISFGETATGDWANLSPGIDYAGTGQHFNNDVGTAADIGTDDFTLEYIYSTTSESNDGIFDIYENAGNGQIKASHVLASSNNIIQVNVTDVSNNSFAQQYTVTGIDLNDGEIHKVRITGDRSGNLEVFVDGASQGTASMTTPSGSLEGERVYLGALADVKLYEWRLTDGNLTNNSGGPGGG